MQATCCLSLPQCQCRQLRPRPLGRRLLLALLLLRLLRRLLLFLLCLLLFLCLLLPLCLLLLLLLAVSCALAWRTRSSQRWHRDVPAARRALVRVLLPADEALVATALALDAHLLLQPAQRVLAARAQHLVHYLERCVR